MKRYYHRSETPMSFHHVLQFLGFTNTLSVVTELLQLEEYASFTSWPDAIAMFLIGSFPSIAACLFLFGTGWRKVYKKYAFAAVHVWLYGVLAVNCLFFLVNYCIGEMIFETSIYTLIAAVIWCIPATIYYHKRKPLFYPNLIPESELAETDPVMEAALASSNPSETYRKTQRSTAQPARTIIPLDDEEPEPKPVASVSDSIYDDPSTYEPRSTRRAKREAAARAKPKRFIFQLMVWSYLIVFELIFIAVALLTRLNTYVLIGIFTICCACGIKYHRMMQMSKFERPLIYNRDLFCAAFNLVNVFGYVPIIVCFFINWKTALIGLPIGLFGGAFLTGITYYLIELPLCAMHRALDNYANKHFPE